MGLEGIIAKRLDAAYKGVRDEMNRPGFAGGSIP
jgi:hypothetical protein